MGRVRTLAAWVGMIAALLCLGLPSVAQQKTSPASAAVTVIRAGTLIDGKSDSPTRDQVIVIRGNHIESVGDAASAKVPDRRNRDRPFAGDRAARTD